ncbi:UPF0472 protein C16orf72 homolog [Daphnia pulex]|uniref:Uncharacterized protein n=1 Tax=Daphnia pulex TaxID=6669 RepID=E9FWE9_DAPPU|nr:UPF0472 protein C16orf72 homolog [Daphnia pulex]EFX87878.1 hypothetical protein DAPPUDRAFT_305429 [Daphnia pulex]|eukprot:EFX87878.1 hypothetical protein DAPPUDRAFT_305429 [Daphnia pulex]
MNNSMENGEDPFADIWISNWERQCEIELENEPDLDQAVLSERDLSTQKLWYLFQNSATSVAQLFKDRNQPQVLWLPFQTAAGTITSLYKESTEALRRSSELGIQAGYQRRAREMLAWAKKRRGRNIRREELIAFLTGKSVPGSGASQPRHQMRMGPRPRVSLSDGMSASHHGASALQHPLEASAGDFEPALQAFREALSLPLPSSASSNNSGSSAKSNGRRGSPVHNHSELSAFISHESARHKRPAPASPTHDVIMDSPTHKRSRLM